MTDPKKKAGSAPAETPPPPTLALPAQPAYSFRDLPILTPENVGQYNGAPQAVSVPLSILRLSPDNPRTISPEDLAELVESLIAFPEMLLLRFAIGCVEADSTVMILAGSQRSEAKRHLYALKPDEKLRRIAEAVFNRRGAAEADGAELTDDEAARYRALLEDLFFSETFPVQLAKGLSPAQKREFVYKDNSHKGKWDLNRVRLHFAGDKDAEDKLKGWGADLGKGWNSPGGAGGMDKGGNLKPPGSAARPAVFVTCRSEDELREARELLSGIKGAKGAPQWGIMLFVIDKDAQVEITGTLEEKDFIVKPLAVK